jgi:hypothetical protein
MILKNVELHWVKLNPNRPNKTFNTDGVWEVQIRTRDKKQAQEWKEAHLNVSTETDENDKPYYKAMLKKQCKKKDGSDQLPVKVVNGSLEDINPDHIGNGSIANVRLFQYDYEVGVGKQKKKGIASMLMAVQVTTLNEYIPKAREDDFEMTDTVVNRIADNQVDPDDLGKEDDPF